MPTLTQRPRAAGGGAARPRPARTVAELLPADAIHPRRRTTSATSAPPPQRPTEPPLGTPRSVAVREYSIHGDPYGLTALHRVVRRVVVVTGLDRPRTAAGPPRVHEFPIDAWAALCARMRTAARPGAIAGHAFAPTRAVGRIPHAVVTPTRRWTREPGSPPGGARRPPPRDVSPYLAGPDDTLLKVLPAAMLRAPALGGLQGAAADAARSVWGDAWAAELAEAEAWIAWSARAVAVKPGQLYLARAVTPAGEFVGPVKLGFSRDPKRRASRLPEAYQVRTRFRVLAAVPGTSVEEGALHSRLSGSCAVRFFGGGSEWYRPTPRVLSCLDRLLPEVRRSLREVAVAQARHPTRPVIAFLRSQARAER